MDYVHALKTKLARDLVHPGARFLDIGCGEGAVVICASSLASEAIGIDLDPAVVTQATRRSTVSNVHFMVGDAMYLPFEDSSFDVVTMLSTLVIVPDADKALTELRRILKPSGKAVIHFTGAHNPNPVFWHRWYWTNKSLRTNLYSLDAARRELQVHGFKEIEIHATGLTDGRKYLPRLAKLDFLDRVCHGTNGTPDLDYRLSNLWGLIRFASHFFFIVEPILTD